MKNNIFSEAGLSNKNIRFNLLFESSKTIILLVFKNYNHWTTTYILMMQKHKKIIKSSKIVVRFSIVF